MIGLKYIGSHYIEDKKFIVNRPNGSNDYLFLLFHSEVNMNIDGKTELLKPGSLVLFSPNANYCYYNKLKGFDNDWFHFTASGFEDFIKDTELPMNIPFYINDIPWIHKSIQDIEREHILKDIGYKIQLNNLISSFFIQLSRKKHSERSYGDRPHYFTLETEFKDIRSKFLTSLAHRWNVDEMALTVNLSRSRFTYLYKSFFGISPGEDLLTERINMACHLLISTNLNITQIAGRVGYNNIYHFSKQFKKGTKLSPTIYRNNNKYSYS